MRDLSRRDFFKNAAGVGLGISFFERFLFKRGVQTGASAGLPVVISSGGHGLKANEASWEILIKGGSSLDAVERGANVIESDPEDMSVGIGGLPNEEGEVELDASIMSGADRNAGAVGAIKYIENPCSVARLVMERSDHVMLVGMGALRFALAHGFKKKDLLTDKARERWLRWKENLSDRDDWFPPPTLKEEEDVFQTYGTINVLAVDVQGNISGITTTSGLAFKIPGRLGDSPIIGAGLYVDNDVGAAGATGRGEEVIKTCGSFMVVENMRQGMSPQEACEDVVQRIIKWHGGKVDFRDNFVAVNKKGETGAASIQKGFRYAVYNEKGNNLYEATYPLD